MVDGFNPLNPKIYATAEERTRRFEELAVQDSKIIVDGKFVVTSQMCEMMDIYRQAERAAQKN